MLTGLPVNEAPTLGLSKGCTSTEADVWLYNGTLFVRLLMTCFLDNLSN
jgi:hypothetical protein